MPSPRSALMPHGVEGVAMAAVSASHAVVLGRLRDGSTQVLAQQSGQLLSIMGDERCVDVACGRQFVTVLTQSGTIFEWSPSSTAPLSFASAMNKVRIVRIAAGDWHAAALSSSGDLFTWGSDKYGQCGHGSNDGEAIASPRRVSALRTRWVFDVSCGSNHTAVVSLVRRRAPEAQLAARMRPLLQQPLTHSMRFESQRPTMSDDDDDDGGGAQRKTTTAQHRHTRPMSFAAPPRVSRCRSRRRCSAGCGACRIAPRTLSTARRSLS
jgi:hypothetical protein